MSVNSSLYRLLELTRLPVVVDVGSNPIDGDPPYKNLLKERLCEVIGFEPQQDALEKLRVGASDLETYHPHSIGLGGKSILNIFKASGLTSLYKPNVSVFNQFDALRPLSAVINEVEVITQRLDEIREIEFADFLKMDIQGGELAALQSSKGLLSNTAMVQVEVPFLCLYHGQPTFGELDTELRDRGFVPHSFSAIKRMPISPILIDNDVFKGVNQLLEADILYVKNFTRPNELSDVLLKNLAFLAFTIAGSYDLTACLIKELISRKLVEENSLSKLLSIIEQYLHEQKI